MSQGTPRPPSTEETCRATFEGSHEDRRLADKVDAAHPDFACEAYAVSPISPAPVDDSETVLRVIISPRDIDETTGFVHQAPFYKVYQEGLSVVRSEASREQLADIVTDGMFTKAGEEPRAVRGLLSAPVGGEQGIRGLVDESGYRLFGVYDQTVPRRNEDDAPVPTHAGIFLRLPPAGTADRKTHQKDYAGLLRDLFVASQIDWRSSHDGMFQELNDQSIAGTFVIAPNDDSGDAGAEG